MANHESRQALWSVVILSPPYRSLIYQEPDYFPPLIWKPGLRVLVPMGTTNRLLTGVLKPSVALDFPSEIKDIHWPLERDPLISPEYLELATELANRHAVQTGVVLAGVLPGSLQRMPARLVSGRQGVRVDLPGYGSDRVRIRELASEWMEGQLDFFSRSSHSGKVVSVAKDPPWSIMPNARLQWGIMDALWERGNMSVTMLRKMFGPGAGSSLRSLARNGLVKIRIEDSHHIQKPCSPGILDYKLTSDQDNALSRLLPDLEKRAFKVNVLHGITGSGKSIVYMHLVRRCLEKGRSAFVLAPEIAIAVQLHALALRTLSGFRIVLHHGLKGAKSKEHLFHELGGSTGPVLVVGTRSALFMPLNNIGLIVIDEEHDESFKQEQGFVYQAKEIAHYLARRDKALLILGSATPDIKTYFAASQGRISLVPMQARVGKSLLPRVEFVDLKKDTQSFGPLSKICEAVLKETLSRGEQAVIMHNRRGYSPIIMCSSCSETAKCHNCQVSLTYHKNRQRLVCHYCGHSIPFSIICSKCRSSEFVPLGEGTEKVEEFFQKSLPGIRVLRLDRDSTRNPARTEEMLEEFARNNAQIMVGTQMLSKGHSFPNVTLGIVLDGDLGLGLPDYRSSERIFQLLVQLSGRAGRGEKPGKVLIQTRNPDHYCWKYVAAADYIGFFEEELRRRRIFGYPPFIRLGLIRISFSSLWKGKEKFISSLEKVVSDAGGRHGVKIMGPAPAPLSRLKNRDRFHLLLKARQWSDIRNAFTDLLPYLCKGGKVRASLDLDPLNML